MLASLGADAARGGFARFNARTIGALPWAAAAARDHGLSEAARAAALSTEIPDAIPAIDDAVARFLGLGREERRVLSTLA